MENVNRRKLLGLLLGASAAAIGGSALLTTEAEAAPLQLGPGAAGTADPISENAQYFYYRRRRRYWRRRRRIVRYYFY